MRSESLFLAACAVLTLRAAAAAAAAAAAGNLLNGKCVDSYNSSQDYFPDKAYPAYAALFNATYLNSYKVVKNFQTKDTLVLYQCGTPKPSVSGATAYFEVPVTNVALGDTTFIPRIEQLGERTSIVAWTSSYASYISSPCMNAMLDDGAIAEAIYTPNGSYNSCVNNTELEALGVDATFAVSTFRSCDDGTSTELYNGVAVGDLSEEEPNANLKIAEWIKYFAYLYNQEALANDIFASSAERISCTENNAQQCSVLKNDVANVSWVPFYANNTGWALAETGTYYDEAITAAGGNLLICPGSVTTSFVTSSLTFKQTYLSDEEFVACYANANVCIFGGNFSEIYSMTDAEYAKTSVLNQLACIQNKTAFDQSKNAPNSFFEDRIAVPDVLVQDLVLALHGDDTKTYGITAASRVWLRSVFTEPVGVLTTTCADTSSRLVLQGSDCTDTVVELCAGSVLRLGRWQWVGTTLLGALAALAMLGFA